VARHAHDSLTSARWQDHPQPKGDTGPLFVVLDANVDSQEADLIRISLGMMLSRAHWIDARFFFDFGLLKLLCGILGRRGVLP
jgi:hypothetical protein